MSKLLIGFVEKRGGSRHSYGILSGAAGIVCNLLLCITKFIVGSLSGSISITADALNNLSDMASNSVTIAGSKLASKPVDEEHPFGHGRLEYISALAVSGLIFVMGFELAKSSIEKIIHPNELDFSIVYIIVLGLSISVKLWMAYFNNKLYKITDNVNLKAVKQDSLNDCFATLATIISLVVSKLFGLLWFDGAIGLGVAVFILASSIGMVKDIVGPLLGQAPNKELVEAIEGIINEPEIILGVHDLIIHDYGPGRVFASAHAEVRADVDIMEIHDVIDETEQKILNDYNIIISIHMDPIKLDDIDSIKLKHLAQEIVKDYNNEYSIHDFRTANCGGKTEIIFDLTVPFGKTDAEKINNDIKELFAQKNGNLVLNMTIEHPFT